MVPGLLLVPCDSVSRNIVRRFSAILGSQRHVWTPKGLWADLPGARAQGQGT